MSTRKKLSSIEIERILLEDAGNPDAWEKPISVKASSKPRPSWYRGATTHAEPHRSAGDPRLIGEMTMTFANLEFNLEVAIWQLVAAGNENQRPLMEAVTTEMSFDRKVQAFASLFRLRFPDESEDRELQAIVSELFIAHEERNGILHSGSYSGDVAVITRAKVSKSKDGLHRQMHVAPERLASIRDHIDAVSRRFAHFSMTRIQQRIAVHESRQQVAG
jgi:hypothetical protein